MKFIDLQQQYQQLKPKIDQAIANVLEHGQFIKGPEIDALEHQLADYVGVSQAILCSSGTTALHVALMALDVGPGDEVITSAFSFFAMAEIVTLLGAKIVYVDIDPETYNINPQLIEAAVTKKTKAIVPVSLYGQCADMDAINAIAARHKIAVIEDACQSFGAVYKDRRSCGISTIACTSFFPSKPLGAYGDAGACFTSDEELAKKMRLAIDHGQSTRYNHVAWGFNGRCDTIQAAVLLQKFTLLDQELEQRRQVAKMYDQVFSSHLKTPYIEPHNISAYAQYTINVDHREQVQQFLNDRGIPTAVHYPKGLHEQPIALQSEQNHWHLPVTENAAKRVLSLPFHPYMQAKDVVEVAEAVIYAQSMVDEAALV